MTTSACSVTSCPSLPCPLMPVTRPSSTTTSFTVKPSRTRHRPRPHRRRGSCRPRCDAGSTPTGASAVPGDPGDRHRPEVDGTCRSAGSRSRRPGLAVPTDRAWRWRVDGRCASTPVARECGRRRRGTRWPCRASSIAVGEPAHRAPTTMASYPLSLMACLRSQRSEVPCPAVASVTDVGLQDRTAEELTRAAMPGWSTNCRGESTREKRRPPADDRHRGPAGRRRGRRDPRRRRASPAGALAEHPGCAVRLGDDDPDGMNRSLCTWRPTGPGTSRMSLPRSRCSSPPAPTSTRVSTDPTARPRCTGRPVATTSPRQCAARRRRRRRRHGAVILGAMPLTDHRFAQWNVARRLVERGARVTSGKRRRSG